MSSLLFSYLILVFAPWVWGFACAPATAQGITSFLCVALHNERRQFYA